MASVIASLEDQGQMGYIPLLPLPSRLFDSQCFCLTANKIIFKIMNIF